MSNERAARDELYNLIEDTFDDLPGVYAALADAILAAGYRKPRTITTAEELDALPDRSAVVDKEGDVLSKQAHWWHSYETAPLMSRKVAKYGPLTVLYEPEPLP